MNNAAFFAALRGSGPFGASLTQDQVDGCEIILSASERLPIEQRAYLLATAAHETAFTMHPVRETLASSDAQMVSRLDNAWRKGQLTWVARPYWRFDHGGRSWAGRGYVQLTHRENYERASVNLGVDLLADPNLAMQPSIAAQILVRGCTEGWFTGRKLSDYLPGDYLGARRVVNGTDRAAQIARYARNFEAALRAGAAAPVPTPRAPSFWAGIINFIRNIFGGKT